MLLTMLIVRRVTRPLTSVTASLTAIANGKSDVGSICEDRHDEIGEIARTVAVFKNNSLERRSACARSSLPPPPLPSSSAKPNCAVSSTTSRPASAASSTRCMTSSGEFERIARQLTETARTTAELSGQSAGASETASEHVRTAAVASDELSNSITEITRRVQESNGIAAEAVKQAKATDQRMNELSQAGARIGDVVKLITSIAEQTNLRR